MVKLLGRRLLATIPLLFLVSLVVFALVHALPGDPAVLFLGEEADPETLARFRVRLGLDRPLVAQYAAWLGRALRGDLGRSLRTNQPVAEAILERLPVTLELLVAALSVSLAIAIPMGIVSAVKRNSGVDLVSTVFALVGFAMPGFWLGIILIYVFALLLRWLPPSGWVPLPASVPQNLLSLVLPAFTLGRFFPMWILWINTGMSCVKPVSGLTLICSFMTSPHSGAPTNPVPTLSSSLGRAPTLRGLL